MKMFVLAAFIAIGMAVAAAFVLDAGYQTTAANQFTTSGVRLADPGSNLVDWR